MKLCPKCQFCYEDVEEDCNELSHPSLIPARPGSTLIADKYRLKHLLSRGGVGAVYSGSHEVLDRAVAIKLLRQDYVADPQALERFRREALAAARLRHPNVVMTQDYGRLAEGGAYIIMELVEGQTLRERLEVGGRLSVYEALLIARQVTDGIEAAHSNGIIHRDLKPSNIILTVDGNGQLQAKVVDFGIAKLKDEAMAGSEDLTGPETIIGTPRYMSPEQCLGQEVDERSDIYSIGITLYEMLAGRPAYEGATAASILLQQVQQAPPLRLSNYRLDVPEPVEHLVMQMLEKDPACRPQAASEAARSLRSLECLFRSEPVTSASLGAQTVDSGNLPPLPSGAVQEVLRRQANLQLSRSPENETLTVVSNDNRSHEGEGVGARVETGNSESRAGVDGSPARRKDAFALSQERMSAGTLHVRVAARRRFRPALWLTGAVTCLTVFFSLAAATLWFGSNRRQPASQKEIVSVEPSGRAEDQREAHMIEDPTEVANNEIDQPFLRPDSKSRRAITGRTSQVGTQEKRSQPVEQQENRVDNAASEADLRASLDKWIHATNNRDIKTQMEFYSPVVSAFYLTRNVPAEAVRSEKSQLFGRARTVDISASEPAIDYASDGRHATMRFRKKYVIEGERAARRGEVIQELRWKKTEQGWRIEGERDLKVIR